jgi:hypothetical protein
VPGLLVGRLLMPTAPLIPAAAVPGVPAELERPPVPLLTWPWDREPSFLAWLHYAGDTALTSWVRHRFGRVSADCEYEPPVPHAVYLIRSATPGTFYVGISMDWPTRLAAHQRAARRLMRAKDNPDKVQAYRLDAWEAFDMRHGFDRVESVIVVPDKVSTLLAEVLWTCLAAAAGYTVFGHWLGDLCPAKAWLERPPSWARNTVVPVRSPAPINAGPGARPA